MTIAYRIQNIRKVKGVSRQTVSKWESEQTIPDMDKVIL